VKAEILQDSAEAATFKESHPESGASIFAKAWIPGQDD
jgi:hypothetical protein